MVKLRQSHTSDIEQVRKAVRAAIVLIPLLGITNILNMTESPLHRSPIEFALWSYTTHFLVSFQGFFIATIYCFLNNEVNERRMKKKSICIAKLDQNYWFVAAGESCADQKHRRVYVVTGSFGLAAETAFNVLGCVRNGTRHRATVQWHQQQVISFSIQFCVNFDFDVGVGKSPTSATRRISQIATYIIITSTQIICIPTKKGFRASLLVRRNRHRRLKQRNWITLCFNEQKVLKDRDINMQRQPPESVLHI